MDMAEAESEATVAGAANATRGLCSAAYRRTSRGLERQLKLTSGTVHESLFVPEGLPGRGLGSRVDPATAEQAFLRSSLPPPSASGKAEAGVVDLFAGCGGLSLGISEGLRAVGRDAKHLLAVDLDRAALDAYAKNFACDEVVRTDVRDLFDGGIGSSPTRAERALRKRVGAVEILLGGPPCQGHSDFNNSTRNNDSRNSLYSRMVRAAEVLKPEHLVVENVPGAIRDRNRVVQRGVQRLSELGYAVSLETVDIGELGIAQARKRLVLVASRGTHPDVASMIAVHRTGPRTVWWAIGDLEDAEPTAPFDESARSATATVKRIDHLFEHDLYELPNELRPPCHQGDHSYVSIYGRLRPDAPSQTITTGFYSMCMGRYVHPTRRRTLTAHEAARLQFFPDFFDLSSVEKRGDLARMIGNAVPPKLAYVLAIELFR